MLTIASLQDAERYAGAMYEMALDPARSGYPTYADGLRTRADLLNDARRAVEAENAVLLLFWEGDALEGWLMLDRDASERYLQLCGYGVRRASSAPAALGELLAWLRERFAGYTLYCGLPGENLAARFFLQKNSFACVEQSWNHVLKFGSPAAPARWAKARAALGAGERILPVGPHNYEAFRAVYRPDESTYWNCDRILPCLERWSIFLYYAGETPEGAVLAQNNGTASEIFGLVLPGGGRDARAGRALLAAALEAASSAGARQMTFFCEPEVCGTAQALGFRCVGQYLCLTRTV